MDKEQEILLFKQQFAAYNFETQFCAAVAGVQSGKTFLGAHWTEKKIQELPKGNGLIVAPTHNILRAATLKKFFEIAPYYRKNYKEQKGEIHLPKGGIIYVRSADNPLGIEGITADFFWLDEGGMTSVLTWTVLRSRVSMTGGQGLITTTPYNMGWLYQDFYIKWRDKLDKNLSFFSWKSTDNPRFSKEFYDAEKQRLRSEEFARRYMGEFRKMTGLVWDLPPEQIIDPTDIIKTSEVRIMGVDWGWENPAAISVWYYKDNNWYKADEWKQSHRTTAEIIQVIQNKISEHRITRVYPDPAEPDRIEECRRAGIPVMEVSKDIKGGVSLIQQLIREKRIFIFNNCKDTIDEWSMYHYEETKDGKEATDLPFAFNNHLADADRYCITSYQPRKIMYGGASESIKKYYPEIGL